jgi:hypothetical protein
MDPNTNQPGGPQRMGNDPSQQPVPPAPAVGPPPTPAPAGSTVPDWQQGLVGTPPQQPAEPGTPPPAAMPGPVVNPAPHPGQPGSMPAGPQPGWAVPGAPAAGPAVPPAPMGMHDMSMGMSPEKRQKQLLVVVGVIVVVILIVVASYFMFLKKDGGAGKANKTAQKSTQSSAATDMATLKNVKLNLPDSITGYTARTTGVDTVKDFISNDNTCEFIAGTVQASQLPGADLNAIVDPQLKTLRDAGATVNGPTAGAALELKDKASNKLYSMPTLNFAFSQDKKHASVHYSAVILSSTDRAIINRTCVNKDGNVDQARLSALDDIAKNVTVTIVNQ